MGVIRASASPVFRDWVRRAGQENDFTTLEYLIDLALQSLLDNDMALQTLIGSAVRGIDWQESVIDKDLTAPPGSPSTGDRYLISSPATGAWVGHDYEIVTFDGLDWEFTENSKGQAVWVEDENTLYIYNGTTWTIIANAVDHGTLTGLADDDHSIYLTEARADLWLATKTTADIAEDPTALYFTDARVNANANVISNTSHRNITSANPHGITPAMIGALPDTHVGDQLITTGAGRYHDNVTNQYLRGEGDNPTNLSPFVLPFDTTLIAMSASCFTASSWAVEVHMGGSLVSGATLSMSAPSNTAYVTKSINFSAGDAVQVYLNGSSVDYPRVNLVFKRR